MRLKRELFNWLKTILHTSLATLYRAKASRKPAFSPDGRVMILAPHPDDEVFGCGGLIARLVAEGRAPHVAVLTGGEGSHDNCCAMSKAGISAARRGLTHLAARELGLPESHIHELDFADGKIGLDHGAEYGRLKHLIAELEPATILVPHRGERWPDHLAVRRLGLELAPENATVYEYCVWFWYYSQSALDWHKAYSLKMSSEEHARKLAAIRAYHTALAPCGNPWVGVLPKPFVKANSTDLELFLKIR